MPGRLVILPAGPGRRRRQRGRPAGPGTVTRAVHTPGRLRHNFPLGPSTQAHWQARATQASIS